MANRFECGKSLYVFTNAAKHNPTCVIDSHGFRPPELVRNPVARIRRAGRLGQALAQHAETAGDVL